MTVSTLNNQIKALLETTFLGVYIEGEVSNLTYHASGHIYFSIKDANSTMSCVMFRGNAQYMKFRLEVGMKITISGSITAYVPRGNYQLLCNKIEPSGQGSLAVAFEQLKKKLQDQGLFNHEHKKELPKYPKHIVLVTSGTGAAIEDMKKVAYHRWPLCKFTLIPTLVQGDEAQFDIVHSIKKADTLNADIIIVGRGGGSVEDLWAFNEQSVAMAIYEALTPIISAVGHETDTLISDFVADIRAATPSNAMEIALPDINEYRIYLDNLVVQFNSGFKSILLKKSQEIHHLNNLFEQNSFERKFEFIQKEIRLIKENFQATFLSLVNQKQSELNMLKENLKMNNPDKKIVDGFVQISKENQVISLENLEVNDMISLQTSKNSVLCQVIQKSKI